MTVYVDDMYKNPMGQFGRMKMSHMIADSTEELLQMADKIGVQRKWLQHKGSPDEHFDIATSKRELAISAGAVKITMRELAMKCRERRIAFVAKMKEKNGEPRYSGREVPESDGRETPDRSQRPMGHISENQSD